MKPLALVLWVMKKNNDNNNNLKNKQTAKASTCKSQDTELISLIKHQISSLQQPPGLTPPKSLSHPAFPCSTGRVTCQKDRVWHFSKFVSPPHLLGPNSLCLMRRQLTKPSLVCKTEQFLANPAKRL